MSISIRDIEAAGFDNLFLNQTPLIDVRAPVEFALGHLPGAVNLPLLNDEERAAVGTMYKNEGQAAAIQLGHKFVSGSVKDSRVNAWREHLEKNPGAVIYCFRGGLRSQISREWIFESGIERPLIRGGYKAARNFLIESMARLSVANKYIVITGPTGSGKTDLLTSVSGEKPVLDLEALANHRGSAFGGYDSGQPTQVNFENRLAVKLLELGARGGGPVLVEDESRMIGKISVPAELYFTTREEPVVLVDETIESRAENIFQEYVVHAPDHAKAFINFETAVKAISKKLGGVNAKEVLELIAAAKEIFILTGELKGHHAWIEKLLVCYYDPLYNSNLHRRDPRFIFTGTRQECREFLRTGLPSAAVKL